MARPWQMQENLSQLQAKWCPEAISCEDDCNPGTTLRHNSCKKDHRGKSSISISPGKKGHLQCLLASQKDLTKRVTLTSYASKDESIQVWAASNTYSYTVHLDECNVKEHLVHSCWRWQLLELPIIEPVWTSEVDSARGVVPCWLLKHHRSSWIHQIFVPTLLRQPWSESEN